MSHVVGFDVGNPSPAHQCHVTLDLAPQYCKDACHSCFPSRGKPVEVGPANRATVRTKRYCLEDMRSAADAAVDDQLDAGADLVADRGQVIDR